MKTEQRRWSREEIEQSVLEVRGRVTSWVEQGEVVPVTALVWANRHPQSGAPFRQLIPVLCRMARCPQAIEALDRTLRDTARCCDADAVLVVGEGDAVPYDPRNVEVLTELQARGLLGDYPGCVRVVVAALSLRLDADEIWGLKIERSEDAVLLGEWERMALHLGESGGDRMPLTGLIESPATDGMFGNNLVAG